MGARRARPELWLPGVVAALLVAAAWEAVARRDPYLLPRLGAVGAELRTDPGLYLVGAATTLGEALAGLGLGGGTALLLAVLVSELAVLRRAVLPLAVVVNVTPAVAVAPALVVALGFGPAPKVAVTALVTFFPVLVGTVAGLRSVPAEAVALLASVRASRLEVLWWLRLPASLPFVLAALRVVLPLSLVGAVVAEFVAAGSSAGLGTVIAVASATSALPRVYAAVACLAVLGLTLLALVILVERRVLSWHDPTRDPR